MMIAPVSLVWVGLLLGVSFLATPVKFRAESLTVPVALDVGRVTFRLFGRVELLLSILLVVATLSVQGGAIATNSLILVGLALGVVLAQTLWVRPLLDERVELVLQGETPQRSSLHKLYVVLEVGKLALLVLTGVLA